MIETAGVNMAALLRAARDRGYACELRHAFPKCVATVKRGGVGFLFQYWPGFLTTVRRADIGQLSDKVAQKALLAEAGLPVPELLAVAPHASALATRVSRFPVVLKPRLGEGGVGVHAGLQTREDLREQLERAGSDRELFVEEHVHGDHFRIQCVSGKFAGCVQRRPPVVVGDGLRSVTDLVAMRNVEPMRRPVGDTTSLIHTIEVDEDVLRSQGVALDTVPAAGHSVTVNPSMLAATGADRVDMAERVHPSTVSACERFAHRHDLFLVGFDFISSDISRPCTETGAFNEVNVCNVDFGMVEACNVGRQWPVSRDIWRAIDFDSVARSDFPHF